MRVCPIEASDSVFPVRSFTRQKCVRWSPDKQDVYQLSDRVLALTRARLPTRPITVAARQMAPIRCLSSPEPSLTASRKPIIVGLGSVGLDYLAQVAAFPKPDEKLRTEKMEVGARAEQCSLRTQAAA